MTIIDKVKAILEAKTEMGKDHHTALTSHGFNSSKSWQGTGKQEHSKEHTSSDAAKDSVAKAHEHLVSKGFVKKSATFSGHHGYKHTSGATATVTHDTRSNRVVVTTDK